MDRLVLEVLIFYFFFEWLLRHDKDEHLCLLEHFRCVLCLLQSLVRLSFKALSLQGYRSVVSGHCSAIAVSDGGSPMVIRLSLLLMFKAAISIARFQLL